jgi:adenosylcobinamide-phosphate synthase
MWLAAVVGVPLLKSTFALRELRLAARQVQLALQRGDLPAARAGLAALVSRDPQGLDEALIAAAVIESLAENLSDAVVAPLCAWVCFGLPGAVVYRTVNTHDALFGYHGEYEWLGKAAARLDDLLNLVPARLTAGLLVAAAAVSGADPIRAGRTVWREAGQTDSPNAGWPMAAMAGALGVELTKVDHYQLGAGGAAPTAATIKQADRLVLLATSGAITLAILGRWLWQRKG